MARHRIQIDFSEAEFARLEELQGLLEVKSNSEVLRHGLKVLRWLVQADPDQYVEVREGEEVVQRIQVRTLLL